MEKAKFNLSIAEIVDVPSDDFKHPFLTMAKFVFADDKGNQNSQGIEVEDFDEVIRTSIHMPIKMNFLGEGVGNHLGSYVIGHITSMEKSVAENGDNQLIGSAFLYSEEYPEEITYLKTAQAAGEAPGISYELAYEDSVVKNGVQWLKKIVTAAATFVRTPAYGKRTSLLALASAKSDDEFMAAIKKIAASAEETPQNNPKEGGNTVDEKELEKVQNENTQLKAEAETKTARISELEETLGQREADIKTLTEKIDSLEKERTLETRIRKLAEAGITLEADAEKAAKKKEFWLSLSDEAFEEYVSDIVEAKKAAKKEEKNTAFASFSGTPVPKPSTDSGDMTLDDIRGMFSKERLSTTNQ